MTWLIAIICVVLVVVFWRIFLPLAVIAAIALGVLILYAQGDDDRTARKRKITEQTVRDRIAAAKATTSNAAREWEVSEETDPASGERVPRSATVLSDEGLCRLQVEERINGVKLTGIYCSGLKVDAYRDIDVKFDNRPKSDPMRIARFSNGDDVYIPSYQYSYSGHLSYDEFLGRIAGARKVSLLLPFDAADQHWITFSLSGARPALTEIGAVK